MPPEDSVSSSSNANTPTPMSPGAQSISSLGFDSECSPARQPPPYRPPPVVSPPSLFAPPVPKGNSLNTQYKEVVNEFQNAVSGIFDMNRVLTNNVVEPPPVPAPNLPPRKKASFDSSEAPRKVSLDKTDTVSMKSVEKNEAQQKTADKENIAVGGDNNGQEIDNKFSVKEAMMKFNRYASVEGAKMPLSPMGNKKPERVSNYYTHFIIL